MWGVCRYDGRKRVRIEVRIIDVYKAMGVRKAHRAHKLCSRNLKFLCEGRLLSHSVARVTEMLFRRYEGVGTKLPLKWYHENAVFAIGLAF
jgi:hypothetical protein